MKTSIKRKPFLNEKSLSPEVVVLDAYFENLPSEHIFSLLAKPISIL